MYDDNTANGDNDVYANHADVNYSNDAININKVIYINDNSSNHNINDEVTNIDADADQNNDHNANNNDKSVVDII